MQDYYEFFILTSTLAVFIVTYSLAQYLVKQTHAEIIIKIIPENGKQKKKI